MMAKQFHYARQWLHQGDYQIQIKKSGQSIDRDSKRSWLGCPMSMDVTVAKGNVLTA